MKTHSNHHHPGMDLRQDTWSKAKSKTIEGWSNVSSFVRIGPISSLRSKEGTTAVFFVDYRKPNIVAKKDTYRLSRMDECIDSLREATIFTTIDGYAGF